MIDRAPVGDCVHGRVERIRIADLAGGLEALSSDRLERQVDAHLRGFADGLVVDHKPCGGLTLRHDEAEAGAARLGGVCAHRLEQPRAAEGAVGDDEYFLHRCGLISLAWRMDDAGAGSHRGRRGCRREDAVFGARHAVLERAADDGRDAVEVEHRWR